MRDNEQCDRICVVHFVDDRAAVASLEARVAAGDAELLLAEAGGATAAAAPGRLPSQAPAAVQPDVALQVRSRMGSRVGVRGGGKTTTAIERAQRRPRAAPPLFLQLLERFLPPLPLEARLLMDNVALVDAMYPKASTSGSGA